MTTISIPEGVVETPEWWPSLGICEERAELRGEYGEQLGVAVHYAAQRPDGQWLALCQCVHTRRIHLYVRHAKDLTPNDILNGDTLFAFAPTYRDVSGNVLKMLAKFAADGMSDVDSSVIDYLM